jgi:methylated-DNA-[protein]-cysteine S-methyltransferase
MNTTTVPGLVRNSLQTPVGTITVEAGEDGLRRVGWRMGSGESPAGSAAAERVAADAIEQLADYFAGRRTAFDLPISLQGLGGSSLAVLTALRDTVPFGETVTYGALAERSGSAVPARAIGSIMGSNPVPIIIGCHRVVASDGLGGYSGGEPGRGRETKIWLLEHEGALPPTLL